MPEVTVGIDIGTSSVKAVAADGDGTVVAQARIPHDVQVPAPDSSTTPRSRGRPDPSARLPRSATSTCAG